MELAHVLLGIFEALKLFNHLLPQPPSLNLVGLLASSLGLRPPTSTSSLLLLTQLLLLPLPFN